MWPGETSLETHTLASEEAHIFTGDNWGRQANPDVHSLQEFSAMGHCNLSSDKVHQWSQQIGLKRQGRELLVAKLPAVLLWYLKWRNVCLARIFQVIFSNLFLEYQQSSVSDQSCQWWLISVQSSCLKISWISISSNCRFGPF